MAEFGSLAPDDGLTTARNAVASQYPALAPHLRNSVISYGTPVGEKNTIEIFNRGLKGDDLHAAIAGDMLHRLGSIEPSTGLPVDPKFYQMRRELATSRDVDHRRIDRDAYQREQSSPFPPADYPAWDQHSRIDSYVRAGLFPKQNPGWDGFLTPEMQPIFGRMNAYLKGKQNFGSLAAE